MTDQTKRDKMLQRVMNLRAKAEDDGASEAEMNEAFLMAQKLMDSYNIEEAELALAEAEGRIELKITTKVADASALKGKRQRHKVISTISSIAEFTSTRAAYNRYSGNITFVGHRPDVELANYLTSVIREALDREYDNYRRSNTAVGYGAKNSFQIAMAYRIASRLHNMAAEAADKRESNRQKAEALKLENSRTASSTALVVSEIAEQKRKETDNAFKKAFPTLRTTSGFNYGRNSTAHGAGRAAGSRVNLGRSISSFSQKKIA